MLDSASSAGTLPGALLQTLVAQQVRFADQGGHQMALTMLPPSAKPVRGPRFALMTPVGHGEGTQTAVALQGAETEIQLDEQGA